MGRKRSNHFDLPARVHRRARSYYYVFRGRWYTLGPSRTRALTRAGHLNSLPKEKRAIELGQGNYTRQTFFGLDSGDARLEKQRAWSEAYLGDKCAYCGGQATTIDHLIPLSIGGNDNPSNWVAACQPCNSKKNARHPLEFLSEIAKSGSWPS